MIVLFTDFGRAGPYIGQIHLVLAQSAPGIPVIDLFHAVPAFDIRAGAYLLPAYTQDCPVGVIIVAVVDPGVGGARRPIILHADGRTYVGPDNGLFDIVARRAKTVSCTVIDWRPAVLSATFHGRDLFAPVAAMLSRGQAVARTPTELTPPSTPWPDDLAQILYVDEYGNAVSGVRAASVGASARIFVGGQSIPRLAMFEQAAPGACFWYENANGLIEIAVNRGRADALLGLCLGAVLKIES